MTPRPPVIVIGMHRSGTSMITRVLERLGLFMGWRKDINDEALFFLRLNEWLLSETGHRWDRPPGSADWPGNPVLAEILARRLRSALRSIDAVAYWGLAGLIAHRNPFGASFPWGWKDPRNTVTLRLWLDIFPQARVLHIRRHGIDVANSLYTRNRKLGEAALAKEAERHLPFGRLKPLWLSPRCANVERAFSIWEEYSRHAETYLEDLGPRALDIRYEDFLNAPQELASRIAAFCGVTASDDAVASACGDLDFGRAYAYQSNPAMMELADRLSDRLAAHGY